MKRSYVDTRRFRKHTKSIGFIAAVACLFCALGGAGAWEQQESQAAFRAQPAIAWPKPIRLPDVQPAAAWAQPETRALSDVQAASDSEQQGSWARAVRLPAVKLVNAWAEQDLQAASHAQPANAWEQQPYWHQEPLEVAVSAEATAEPTEPISSRRVPPMERDIESLKQRVKEIDLMFKAQEDATRTIIRQSFAERGSQINDFVILGGTFEGLTGWAEDFDGIAESVMLLNTAELDLEIQVNPWTLV